MSGSTLWQRDAAISTICQDCGARPRRWCRTEDGDVLDDREPRLHLRRVVDANRGRT